MSEAKRYEAVHLRYEESNIRYGEGCEVEVVAAQDFDTLAQRLQEAERLLVEASAWMRSASAHYSAKNTHAEQIDAFLASSG